MADPTQLAALTDLLFALADDKLMLGHRNGEWTGLGPILEEDIAFSSLAQDELAHALALYEFVGALHDKTADELAFGREPGAYRCAAITEHPDDFDWALAMARKFYCDHFDLIRLERLTRSSDSKLAGLAKRLHAEEELHVQHVDGWMKRLGAGTDESRDRMQSALDQLASIAGSLAEATDGQDAVEASGHYPANDKPMLDCWLDALRAALDGTGLHVPTITAPTTDGGRRGVHSEHFTELLDEMCEVYRTEPGVAW